MRCERIENEWETYGIKDPVKIKSKVNLYIYKNVTRFLLPVTPPNRVLQSVRRVYTRNVGSKVTTVNRLRKNISKNKKLLKSFNINYRNVWHMLCLFLWYLFWGGVGSNEVHGR